jgi:hypothetical protein
VHVPARAEERSPAGAESIAEEREEIEERDPLSAHVSASLEFGYSRSNASSRSAYARFVSFQTRAST